MDVAANRRCWLSLQARGEFRYGNSSECHRQAINWNQDLYRLDASAGARVFGNFCGLILALSRQLTGSKYCPTAVKVAVRCTVQR